MFFNFPLEINENWKPKIYFIDVFVFVSYQILHSMSMRSNLSYDVSGITSLVTQCTDIERLLCFVVKQLDNVFKTN